MRKLPRPFKMPWGKGMVIDEVSISSQYHEPTIQLLEFDNGDKLLRFCSYSHGVKGVAVITEAEHLCMKMRGVKNNASVSAAAFRGIYEKKEEKENIVNIIRKPSKTFFAQNS